MIDYAKYLGCIEKNIVLKPDFWNFKSDPDFRAILEHVSPQQGQHYLNLCKSEFPFLFCEERIHLVRYLVSQNDRLGKPVKSHFSTISFSCSPTNWRYVYQSLIVLKYVSSTLGLKKIDIFEVGGGYGGLSWFLRQLAHFFGVEISSYTIFDLPQTCALIERYDATSSKFSQPRIKTCHNVQDYNHAEDSKSCFFISSHAFSEIERELQELYEQRVISHCAHGFLAWNAPEVHKFTKHPLTIEPERPQTGYGTDNSYVWF